MPSEYIDVNVQFPYLAFTLANYLKTYIQFENVHLDPRVVEIELKCLKAYESWYFFLLSIFYHNDSKHNNHPSLGYKILLVLQILNDYHTLNHHD